jgi:Glycosyltransferase family 87
MSARSTATRLRSKAMRPRHAEATVLPRPVSFVLALLSGIGALSYLMLAFAHLRDRFQVHHLQGVWMALADYAERGVLYPALYDGSHYGGTRWMPLPILANSLAARVTGDLIIGGKTVAILLMLCTVAAIFVVLRRLGCPTSLSGAVAVALVTTETGLYAGTTIGGDLLPLLLGIVSLALVEEDESNRRWLASGALAGLAFCAKLTGVWAAISVLLWLLVRKRWANLWWFVASAAVVTAVALGAVEIASHGKFHENMLKLIFAGVGGASSLARAPSRLYYNLEEFAVGAWMLVPLAVLGVFFKRTWRRPEVWHIALAVALVLLLVVYADIGTGLNQALDFAALVLIATGILGARAVEEKEDGRWLAVVVGLTVSWVLATGIVGTLVPDLRQALPAVARLEPAPAPIVPLRQQLEPGDSLLSEDPYAAISTGRRPVVLDPFMLLRLARDKPGTIDDLVARIESQEFDLVALDVPLEGNESWWKDFHFGPQVADALRAQYERDGSAGPYFVYRRESHGR